MEDGKTVVIAGGTGMIGSALADRLQNAGWQVRILSRRDIEDHPFEVFRWDPSKGEMQPGALAGARAVVNLAGAGIADKRWTGARKKRLLESREQPAHLLVQEIERQENGITCHINASAIGFYGDRGDQWCREMDPPRKGDFLSDLCTRWENAVDYRNKAVRKVIFRIGLVLSSEGGVLARLLPQHRMMVAPIMGSGDQYYSWIHIEDLVSVFHRALENENMEGVYNAVAPEPVRNSEFSKSISRALGRPFLPLPAPSFALRMGLGEMSDALLYSQRVSSEKIRSEGYEFQYADLNSALRDLISG